MDASILVAGNHAFLSALSKPIYDFPASTIEVVHDPCEAVQLIQAQQPDLLIVQASQPGGLDLCHQIKSQSRLSWIYCIVVDDQSQQDPKVTSNEFNSVYVALDSELEIKALEGGADAYVQIIPCGFEDASQPMEWIHWQNRRLHAQIQVGLRRVHTYRELMRTNDLLSAIALSDPLTELNNRRAFEWELPRQIHNARARNLPISLLMLDVDYFKSINDTYGHVVGDRALKLLSARLRHNLRFYDTPFRYGGEEFAIILSNTNCEEATMVAHRVCHLIADQPFVIHETLNLKITISAGSASLLPEDDLKGMSLLQRADQNLLQAKALGRNRVVSSVDLMPLEVANYNNRDNEDEDDEVLES
jgi:two-component system cell cycle response regulator